MITVVLKSKEGFLDKLKTILDKAKESNETAITVITSRSWHIELFDLMSNHKSIGGLKMDGKTFFTLKGMRVELKAIDFYI